MLKSNINKSKQNDLILVFYRYLSFWPYFLISILVFSISTYAWLRYENNVFTTSAKIKILDDAMDSDMSLPTAMTIFNRSTINLENEVAVIKSNRLLKTLVNETSANVRYFVKGNIKTSEIDFDQFSKLGITFINNINVNDIPRTIEIEINFNEKGIENIYTNELGQKNFNNYLINDLSTSHYDNDLPFKISINPESISKLNGSQYLIKIVPLNNYVQFLSQNISVSQLGLRSDILLLTHQSENKNNTEFLLNKLIEIFDQDGIFDRKIIFKQTIDFVDLRFGDLETELSKIESKKENFKINNELTYLESNAEIVANQKVAYSDEIIKASVLLEELKILIEHFNNNKNSIIPFTLSGSETDINNQIEAYNSLVLEMQKTKLSLGPANILLQNLESQIETSYKNILTSLIFYKSQLEVKIESYNQIDMTINNDYASYPSIEKNLRSINREQEIKEALFLLLLQKREEAAINFAVTKPSIKIIDSAVTDIKPVYPNKPIIMLLSIVIGFIIPFLFLFLRFSLNTKIHTKQDIITNSEIPILAEIPISTDIPIGFPKSTSRKPLVESIRMLTANLGFLGFNDKYDQKNKVILVTSSIKGEGKTLVSANLSSVLSHMNSKVLLIGADLRNPQLHKLLNTSKSQLGMSDYIFRKDLKWRDLVIKNDQLDIILSGSIPPNPTELLSSDVFSKFISEVKKEYDHVVIDSAPCLLVSDSFEIIKSVDTIAYVLRSNYSDIKLLDFINENYNSGKLKNIGIVLNGIGNSSSYGYKYGYNYQYQYGYNYGYGYGYSEDDD